MIRKISLTVLLATACQFALADQAFDDNLKKAQGGDPVAQSYVAGSYHYGRGVTQDYQTAIGWARKSATKGNADAESYLGMVYETGQGVKQDYEEAVSWYKKAAAKGQVNAEYALASLYEVGHGVKKDYKEALELYDKAAAKGFTSAKQAGLALRQKIDNEAKAAEAAKAAAKTNDTKK